MEHTRKLALWGAQIWDGLGGPLRPATLLLNGRKITAVLPAGPAPEGYQPVDLTGKTIVPGLFEMHGHFYGRATTEMRSQHAAYCPLYLAGGITTVRTPGEFEPLVTLRWKEDIEKEQAIGPRILSAGSYFDRHPSIVRWIEGSESAEEISEKYAFWRDKVDFVKVYSNTPKEWIAALASLAHRDGLKVYGHLGACSAYDALEAGIDGLEHGLFTMSEFYGGSDPHTRSEALEGFDPDGPQADRVIEKILEKNAAVTPTTITFMLAGKEYTDRIDAVDGWRYLAPEGLDNHRARRAEWDAQAGEVALQNRLVEKQYRFISRIVRGGGRVFCGTDPSYPLIVPGCAIVWEAENLIRCGMDCRQVMLALTSEAAREMKIFEKTGSIEPGKEADLCVLDENPLDDIQSLAAVHSVYKGGRRFDPAALRACAAGMMK